MLPLSMRILNLSWEDWQISHSIKPGAPLHDSHWPETLAVEGFRLPSPDLAFVSWHVPHGSKEQRVEAEQMGKSFIWRLRTKLWRTVGRHILPPSWLNIATCQCVHVNITHLQTFDISNEYLNISAFVLALTRLWLQPAHLEAILVPLWKILKLETSLGEWPNGKSGQDPGSHTNLCHVVLIVTIPAIVLILWHHMSCCITSKVKSWKLEIA